MPGDRTKVKKMYTKAKQNNNNVTFCMVYMQK